MEALDNITIIINAVAFSLLSFFLIYSLYKMLPIDTYKKRWRATTIVIMISISMITAFLYTRWYVLGFSYNHTENLYWNLKDILMLIVFYIISQINFKR